ncbi:MAG: gamma carbonic anhydrase family protein [Pseudomonadota bacterium]
MAIYTLGDKAPNLHDTVWVAPDAQVMGQIIAHEDANIWFGAVLRGDNEPITVGARSNIQELCVLHTDIGFPLTIGADVTVGHKAMLHGCTIGDNSLVGMGATIMNGVTIGKNCIVGAGALIPEGKTIPDNSLVMGVPGKVVKSVDEATAQFLKGSAAHYVQNARRFAKDLKRMD